MTPQVVVIAAGLGTRLRPLTERYAKPVLPIDGKPVIALLLRELAEAGFDAVTVVIGHLGEQVERLSATAAASGSQSATRDRPHPMARPTPFSPPRRWRRTSFSVPTNASRAATSAVSPRRSPHPAPRARSPSRTGRAPSRSATGSSSACSERVSSAAPLWAVGPGLAGHVEARPGKPPFELALAFQHAIDAGERVAGIEIGPTRDLTAPVDVLEENFPYLRNL